MWLLTWNPLSLSLSHRWLSVRVSRAVPDGWLQRWWLRINAQPVAHASFASAPVSLIALQSSASDHAHPSSHPALHHNDIIRPISSGVRPKDVAPAPWTADFSPSWIPRMSANIVDAYVWGSLQTKRCEVSSICTICVSGLSRLSHFFFVCVKVPEPTLCHQSSRARECASV